MRHLLALAPLVVFACCGARAWTADWLNEGGDAQRSRWQKRERMLSPATVKRLQLIWKRKLDDASAGLSAATILGRMVTHRGTLELVIVAAASGHVYAVDGDLGSIFWQRRLEAAPCAKASVAAPVIAPAPVVPGAPAEEDEDDDAPQPPRPIYVLEGDGRLHALHPADGRDLSPAWNFVPPNGGASSLNYAAGTVYTTISRECRGAATAGTWSIDVSRPDTKGSFVSYKARRALAGVTIGTDGTIHPAAAAAFRWTGREWIAGAGDDGRLFVADSRQRVFSSAAVVGSFRRGLATWEDADGARWICAAAAGGIAAFRLEQRGGRAILNPAWISPGLVAAGPPVAAGGVVFALAGGEREGHSILYALNAATGARLYSSGASIASFANPGSLAVANGHVCFTTADDALCCFGFPVDI